MHHFVAIHAAIGLRHQDFVTASVVREYRSPCADRQRHFTPGLASKTRLSTASCSSSRVLGFVPAAARENDDELVAGVANTHVVWADGAAKHLCDCSQGAVADVMPEGVVDVLEVIQVHHERDSALPRSARDSSRARWLTMNRVFGRFVNGS